MYKVFHNEKAVYLIEKKNQSTAKADTIIMNYDSKESLKKTFDSLMKDKKHHKLILVCDDIEKVWKVFSSLFEVIEAAGGLVKNSKGEILFIYRNNKWDLPKGKVEKGEDIKNTSMREVEEECKINKLEIIRELTPTYHIYSQSGKQHLKKTYWFEMKTTDTKIPQPQKEEGITKVKWIAIENLNVVLKNTFVSVRELLDNVLAPKE